MLAYVPEQVFYSARLGDHRDSGGPIGWETPHSRFGSANHLMPQPAAEKTISWKGIVFSQPSTPLIEQEKNDTTPSHCHRGRIWGPYNPVPLNKILSRPHWGECHGQPAEHSTARDLG